MRHICCDLCLLKNVLFNKQKERRPLAIVSCPNESSPHDLENVGLKLRREILIFSVTQKKDLILNISPFTEYIGWLNACVT